jgi:Ca2+-binding RTX toxin-like protein
MLRRRHRKSNQPATFKLNPEAFPAEYARPRTASLEPLEQRVFLSVSAQTLFGPVTLGFSDNYETLSNGSETGTSVHSVVAQNTATFNGHTGLDEFDDTISTVPPVAGNSDINKNYLSVGSGGVTEYGNVATLVTSQGTTTTTTTYSPSFVNIPATMSAGSNYTATYTATSVSTGVTNSTTTISFTYVADLVSESPVALPQSIPASGVTTGYEINLTITATESGTTEPPVHTTEYVSPLYGEVLGITVISETVSGQTFTTTATSELTGTGSGVTVGAPAQLAFTGGPSTLTVGNVSSTPFTVAVEDASGNVVTTNSSSVTVALESADGAILGGTTTVAAVNGVATFSNLTVNNTGTYALVGVDGALTFATSPSFTVSSSAPPTFATLSGGALDVEGTSGDDVITLVSDGTNVTATLNGTPSQAFALSSVTSITVNGNAGNDTITIDSTMPSTLGVSVQGGPGDDTVLGGPGNDTLGGGQGNDSIQGGPGDDSAKGGAGDDTLLGGKGNDTLFGGPGNDLMHGGLGDDYLNGGSGTDYMSAGAGNNTFYAVNGTADQIFAGTATNDSLFYSTSDNPIIESGSIPAGNQTLVS